MNPKSESSACILNDCSNDFNDKQNPIVFNATTMVLANANRIPIDAPNSGPIDLEIIKYKPPEGIISCKYRYKYVYSLHLCIIFILFHYTTLSS